MLVSGGACLRERSLENVVCFGDPLLRQRERQVLERAHGAGAKLQGLAIVDYGLIQTTESREQQSHVGVGLGIQGIDLQGLAILRERLVGVPELGELDAQVVVSFRVVGADLSARRNCMLASSGRPSPANKMPRLLSVSRSLGLISMDLR